jgi:hypothetical protein
VAQQTADPVVQQTVAASLDARSTFEATLIREGSIMSILSVNFARTSDRLDSILEVCAPEAAAPLNGNFSTDHMYHKHER